MKKKNIIKVAIAGLAAIGTTAYLLIKKGNRNNNEEPPANAPQTPIQNPGDQSDFPAALTGEKDLG